MGNFITNKHELIIVKFFGGVGILTSNKHELIVVKFFGGVGIFTSNKPFGFGADPDHDPDPGIFQRNICNCGIKELLQEFAALAEIFGLRLLLVFAASLLINQTYYMLRKWKHINNPSVSSPMKLRPYCTVEIRLLLLLSMLLLLATSTAWPKNCCEIMLFRR